MKDALFLLHILTLCAGVVCVTVTLAALPGANPFWRRAYARWVVAMTAMNANGYLDYYLHTIRKYPPTYPVNWGFAAFLLLQGIVNALVITAFASAARIAQGKAGRIARGFYFLLPALLTALYLALAYTPSAYRHVRGMESFLYYYSILSATLAYGLSGVLILVRIKGLKPSQRPYALAGLALIVLYQPLAVLGQFRYFNPAQPLHPMNTGAVFFLLASGIWLLYACRGEAKSDGGKRDAVPMVPDKAFLERFGITGRESQVIELLLAGLPYKQLADRLGISVSTVKNHLQNIYSKTGARTKLDLLHRMLEPGE